MAAASSEEEEEEDDDGSSISQQQKQVSTEKRRGSILGAVSLIVGTSIGSGILALPHKTSPTGFIPSLLFLVIETLLLAEINDTYWNFRGCALSAHQPREFGLRNGLGPSIGSPHIARGTQAMDRVNQSASDN